ncbi:MAG: EAL domain-containing protein [Micropepsaceae bacterium]
MVNPRALIARALTAAWLAAMLAVAAGAQNPPAPQPKPEAATEPAAEPAPSPEAAAPEPPAAEPAPSPEAAAPEAAAPEPPATPGVPRSGIGGVVVEEGVAAADITSAVTRVLVDGEHGAATYLVDFVNRMPTAQVRILILAPGLYGGRGAPAHLSTPPLVSVDASEAAANIQIIEEGARTKIRIQIPADGAVTAAFRYAAPLNALTVEMWDEKSLARFNTASLVLQGALLGLLTALGAWLAGLAVLRRDRMAARLAALFAATFLALLIGFSYPGPFQIAGILTNAGLALGLFAGASAAALAFVVHAIAPEGRWRSFGWFADYAPWLVTAAGLMAVFNAPYAAIFAKAGAAAALVTAIAVVFARAWEGDGAARRLTLAAIFAFVALAPLAMLELVDASGRTTMLAAGALLSASLLLAAFAISSGQPVALRSRVDRLVAAAPPPPPPFAAQAQQGDDGRFGLALAAAHQGIWDWDLKRDRLFLSPSVEVLLGARPGQLQAADRDWSGHVHREDLATFLGALEDYRRMGDVSFVLDFRGVGLDGLHRWVQLRASFMSDGDKAARCIGLVSDVSAQKETEASLLATARQDGVTGLANRAFFLEALSHRLAFAGAGRPYALLAVDIARFRIVNESLGHAFGDSLLAALAGRIRAAEPDGALAARLGGDVFGLLWAGENADAAAEQAKLVLDTLGVPLELGERKMTPIARGGFAWLDEAGRDAAAVLADVEAALAAARRTSGGTLAIFAPAMRDALTERAEIERDLGGALERGEITVYYQPIVRVADGRPAGFEALLRWLHPRKGLLTAETFAALAEETGLIEPLGKFILETAAKDSARWRRIAPQTPPLFVNVNVSARQLISPAFLDMCERLAADGLIAPREVRLEITETLAIDDAGAAAAGLQRLRRAGYGLVMDDFGTGHSTPSRLAHLPFDAVKIDRSFMLGGEQGRSVLAGLVRLARDLDLEATAEGVETEDDLAFLRANDCLYAQGYFCGKPRDAAAAQAYLLEFTETADRVE